MTIPEAKNILSAVLNHINWEMFYYPHIKKKVTFSPAYETNKTKLTIMLDKKTENRFQVLD